MRRRRGLASRLDSMTVLDDRRFEIRTSKPFPMMLLALGANSCFMMPERVAKTDAFKAIDSFVGSGPFRFVADEWVSGSKVVYARNTDYVPGVGVPSFSAGAKVVNLDRVEWLIMPDSATAAAALQSGEVDWVEQPLIDLAPMLKRNRDIVVKNFDPFGAVGVVVFNHLDPPFDNPKLRQALLPALNHATYLSAVIGDQADFKRTGVGVFPPGTPLANGAGLEALTGLRDLDEARRLVKASGYKGERVVLLGPTDYPTIGAVATMTEALFREVGLNVDFVATDFGTMISRRASQEPVEKGGWSTFCTAALGVSGGQPDLEQHDPGVGQGRVVRVAEQPAVAGAAGRVGGCSGSGGTAGCGGGHPADGVRGSAVYPDRAVVQPERLAKQRDGDRQRGFAGVLEPAEGVIRTVRSGEGLDDLGVGVDRAGCKVCAEPGAEWEVGAFGKEGRHVVEQAVVMAGAIGQVDDGLHQGCAVFG